MAAPTRSNTKSSARRKPAASKAGASTNQARASSNGTKRSSSAASQRSTRSRSTAAAKRSPSQSSARRNGSGNDNGVLDTVKSAAGKAAGPAVALGAAAVGIAGGVALKNGRRKTVLGVKMPKSIGKSLTDIDAKSIAKSVGKASKQFAKTAKGVSKDLERAGDQAERIGKILG